MRQVWGEAATELARSEGMESREGEVGGRGRNVITGGAAARKYAVYVCVGGETYSVQGNCNVLKCTAEI